MIGIVASYVHRMQRMLPLTAFVAPSNFVTTQQSVDIHSIYSCYSNPDKTFIYSFSDSYNILNLIAAEGLSYRYGYTRSVAGVPTEFTFDVASATNPFTETLDTKRWVIVNYSGVMSDATTPIGATWIYAGKRCTSVSSYNNTYLNYVHTETIINSIGDRAFYNCVNLTGNLNLPNTLTYLGNSAFVNCYALTGNLVIPNTITGIGVNTFYQCVGMTGTLTLPTGLTHIGSDAFFNCKFSGSLTLPSTLTTIDGDLNAGTFAYCSNFTGTLTIPASLSVISWNVFRNCTGFSSLVISSGVTEINVGSFQSCTGLVSVSIPSTLTTFNGSSSYGGAFQGCSALRGSLSIPSGTTSIGPNTFANCGFDGTLTLPSSLTAIYANAFYGCSLFTGSLTLPSGLTYIGSDLNSGTFAYCSGFTGELNIPSGCYVGRNAFRNCSGFNHLTLNDGISFIGISAFRGCTGLANVNLYIPSTVTTLEGDISYGGAFQGCSGLRGNLVIPDSLTVLSQYVFAGCGFDGTLTLPTGLTDVSYTSFQSTHFTGKLTIPVGISQLKRYSNTPNFDSCNFTSLDLPSGLTDIGCFIFRGSQLIRIDSRNPIPPALEQIYSTVFNEYSHNNCVVHVPNQPGVLAAYRAATEWNGFTTIIADL